MSDGFQIVPKETTIVPRGREQERYNAAVSTALDAPPLQRTEEEESQDERHAQLVSDALDQAHFGDLAQVMSRNRQLQPDPAARAIKLAEEFEVEPWMVSANMEVYERESANREIESFRQTVASDPALAKWFRNPENVAIAGIDFDPLSNVSRSASDVWRARGVDSPWWAFPADLVESAWGGRLHLGTSVYGLQAIYGLGDIDEVAENFVATQMALQEHMASAPSYRKEWDRIARIKGKNLNTSVNQFFTGFDNIGDGMIMEGLWNAAAGGVGSLGDVISLTWSTTVANPRGFGSFMAEMLPISLPSLATGGAGAVAGSAAGPGGSLAGFIGGTFAGSAAMGAGEWVSDGLARRGVDPTDIDAVKAAFRNPEFMAELKAEANRHGVTYGAVEAISAGFAGKGFARLQKKALAEGLDKIPAGEFLAEAGKTAAVQSAFEFTGVAAGQLAATGDIREVDFGQAVLEAVGSLGHTAGETAIGFSVRRRLPMDTVEATKEFASQSNDNARAIAEAIQVQKMGEQVRESQHLSDLPGEMERFIDNVNFVVDQQRDIIEQQIRASNKNLSEDEVLNLVDEYVEENRDVYFKVSEWNQLWAEQGISGIEKAQELFTEGLNAEDMARMNEAHLNDAFIRVPLGTFVARAATDEQFNNMTSIMRRGTDSPSLIDAREFNQSAAKTGEDLFQEAVPPTEEQVTDDMVLRAMEIAGEARWNTIVEAVSGVLDLGQDTEKVAAWHLLQVVAGRIDVTPEQIVEDAEVAEQAAEAAVEEEVAGPRDLKQIFEEAGVRDPVEVAIERIRQTDRLQVDQAKMAGRIARGISVLAERSGLGIAEFLRRFPVPEFVNSVTSIADMDLQQDDRGVFQFFQYPDRIESIIGLFKDEDASTVIHEFGHFYLTVIGDLVASGDATQQIQEDYDSILKWMGAEPNTLWKDLTVEQQEKFAEGFEKYIMTAQAPSKGLRGAFFRLRDWMRKVYGAMKRFAGLEVTPEIRNVFDRILATDEELDQVLREPSARMMFDNIRAQGGTEKQARDIEKAYERAQVFAQSTLTKQVVGSIVRNNNRDLREFKAGLRIEAEAAYAEDTTYEVRDFIMSNFVRRGTIIEDALKRGDIPWLRRKAVTKNAKNWKRAITIEQIAAAVGHDSAFDLVEELRDTVKKEEYIKSYIEEGVKGFVQPDERQIEREAKAVVHTKLMRQARRLEREFLRSKEFRQFANIVKQAAKKPPKPDEMLIAEAWDNLGKRTLGSITPATIKSQMDQVGKDMISAAVDGRYDDLINLTDRQLELSAQYEVALEAVKLRGKVRKLGQKAKNKKFMKMLGSAGVEGGEGSLFQDSYWAIAREFSLFGKPNEKSGQLFESVFELREKLIEDHQQTVIPESKDFNPKPLHKLTLNELLQLDWTLRHIKHLAEQKDTLRRFNQEVALAEVREATVAELDGNHKDHAVFRAFRKFREAGSVTITMNMLAKLATGKWSGESAVHDHFIHTINSAVDNVLQPRLDAMGERVVEIYSRYSDEEQNARLEQDIFIEELGFSVSRAELSTLAQHRGNLEGTKAITSSREQLIGRTTKELTLEQVDILLSYLDERDWAFIRDRWEEFEKTAPELKQVHLRRQGLRLDLVQAVPFTITMRDGTQIDLPGGYYPLKYEQPGGVDVSSSADPDVDTKTGSTNWSDSFKGSLAQTRSSHRQARRGSDGKTVRLDDNVFLQALRERIVDISIGDEVMYVARLLQDPEIRGAFFRTGNDQFYNTLALWVKDVATQQRHGQHTIDKLIRWTRHAGTISKIGWNMVTALLQPTGLFPAMAKIGVGNVLFGLREYMSNPKKWTEQIHENPAMARRSQNQNPDLDDLKRTINQMRKFGALLDRLKVPKKLRKWIKASMLYYVLKLQHWVDKIVFIGAKRKHMLEDGMSPKAAEDAAVQDIKDIFGSGIHADKTSLERGTYSQDVVQSEWVRAMTFLSSYALRKVGLTAEITGKRFGQGFNGPFDALRQVMGWTTDMMLVFTAEAVTAAVLIRGGGPDEDDPDDNMLKFAWDQTKREMLGSVPIIRDFAEAAFGDSWQTRSAGSWGAMVASMGKFKKGLLPAEEEEYLKYLKRINDPLSNIFGYPGIQTSRFIDWTIRSNAGEDPPYIDMVRGRPLTR